MRLRCRRRSGSECVTLCSMCVVVTVLCVSMLLLQPSSSFPPFILYCCAGVRDGCAVRRRCCSHPLVSICHLHHCCSSFHAFFHCFCSLSTHLAYCLCVSAFMLTQPLIASITPHVSNVRYLHMRMQNGAAIYLASNSSAQISNCSFTGNSVVW
jgi:hypothetical protein